MRHEPRFTAAIALFTAVVLGGVLAACNPEPTCDKAIARVLELIDAENEKLMSKFPERQRKEIAEGMARQMPKDRLVEECTKNFTKEQIACTVAAKSLEDVSKCNQAAALPTAPPTTPAPAEAPATPGQPPATPDQPPATPDQPTEPAQGEAAGAAQPAQPE
jgi:hypothetical protein